MGLLNRNAHKLGCLEKLNTFGGGLNGDHVVRILSELYPSQLSDCEEDVMRTQALLERNTSKLNRLEALEESVFRKGETGRKGSGPASASRTASADTCAGVFSFPLHKPEATWEGRPLPLPAKSQWLHQPAC